MSFLRSTPEQVDLSALYYFLAGWRLGQALPPSAPLPSLILSLGAREQEEEDPASLPPNYGIALHTLVPGVARLLTQIRAVVTGTLYLELLTVR